MADTPPAPAETESSKSTTLSSKEKVRIFHALFRGREDVWTYPDSIDTWLSTMVRRREGMEMGEKRKSYTREFKLEAVRLLETGGKPGNEIEKDLGIGSGQIC